MNNVKVFVLLAGMTALFGVIGGYLGGQTGMILALLFGGGMNVVMFYNSHKLVLRSYGARIVTAAEAPQLYEMVDRLRQRAGLPMPTVAIAPQAQPNAFATGRSPEHAVVCVTEGIMRLVTREQLEGVIAHELAHIKNRDMLLQTVAASMAGAISALAHFGLFFGGGRNGQNSNPIATIALMFLAPVAAMVIQFAISRQREFKADRVGAEISGNPHALAGALERLEAGARQIPMDVSPSVAPLAQVNPLSAVRGGGIMKLFSTHPPTSERVARLKVM